MLRIKETRHRMFVGLFFFFNDTATTEIYTLSLHDALPIFRHQRARDVQRVRKTRAGRADVERSEEHTSELQSRQYLVCRHLLEKKNTNEKSRTARPKQKIRKPHKKHTDRA